MQTNVSERVVLARGDVLAAVQDGVITEAQADGLWQRWSSALPTGRPGGPTFSFVNVLYYFGGMLAIGAMSLFMTRGWELFGAAGLLVISVAYAFGCLRVADHFHARSLPVPAGILATLAVCLVPLATWSAQSLLGLWPPGERPFFYLDYHRLISWQWMTLELATLAMGAVMLWRYRLPFMVMPIAITLWYMSMDFASAMMQNEGFDWRFSRDVTLLFGIATCVVAIWVDLRCRATQAPGQQDYAFWLYVMGAIMFWGGLSLRDSEYELHKFIYALTNVVLVLFGAAIGRRVFTILGALGVAFYLGHLSYQVFKDSLMFPFALTLLGLGVVCLGVWWQRHEGAIRARLSRFVPHGLRP